jgi:hypothetical protein
MAIALIITFSVLPAAAIQVDLVNQSLHPIQVEGSPIELVVEPGRTVTTSLTIPVPQDLSESIFYAEVTGLGLDPIEGTYTAIPATEDTGPFTARPFVRVNRASVRLKPGDRTEIIVTIAVPGEAWNGGRYAAVRIFSAKGDTGTTTKIDTDLIVPVLLTQKGGDVSETAEISGLEVMTNKTDGSTEVTSSFVNTGNHHLSGVVNSVIISDTGGRILATARSEPSAVAMIPGKEVQFHVSLPTSVENDSFNITTQLEKANGQILTEQHESFDQGEREQEITTITSTPGRASGFGAGLAALGAVIGLWRRYRIGRWRQ